MSWFFDINKSIRNGDTMKVIYQAQDGPEQFKILNLSYKSQRFGKTFVANFFDGLGQAGYFDLDGNDIASRIEAKYTKYQVVRSAHVKCHVSAFAASAEPRRSLAALVDASHAGLLGFGAPELLTARGRSGARVLCAYWLVARPCLWAGCVGSRAKARAKDELMGRTHTVLRKACSGGNLKIN